MSTVTKYYSLQGRLSLAERLPNGKPGRVRWLQNAASVELGIEISEEAIKESHSGARAKDFIHSIENAINISYNLHGFTLATIAAALWASQHQVAAGTITEEPLPEDLEVGDYFKLDHEHTSDWALEDSAGTPTELEEGEHYAIVSAFAGHGQILDLTGLTPPILASYSHAATNALALLQKKTDECYLMFDGIDTVSKERSYLQIPRFQGMPSSGLQLVNNEGVGSMDFTGEALFDGTDPDFPLGKFVQAAAA